MGGGAAAPRPNDYVLVMKAEILKTKTTTKTLKIGSRDVSRFEKLMRAVGLRDDVAQSGGTPGHQEISYADAGP